MKTNTNSTELVIIGTMLLPFIYLALIWNQLPAEINSNYDLAGQAMDQMPKQSIALLMGVLSVALYLLLRFLPRIGPKELSQSSNYNRLRFVVSLTFATVTGWMWYMADHQDGGQKPLNLLFAIVGLMLAGMGNYMTTLKPNWFVGIRTPWTLNNETVWRKTHRMGGWLLVLGGLLSAVLALVVPMPYTIAVVTGVILIVTLIPVVYSYVYFRQEKAHQIN